MSKAAAGRLPLVWRPSYSSSLQGAEHGRNLDDGGQSSGRARGAWRLGSEIYGLFGTTESGLVDEVVAPRLNADGAFERPEGLKIRIYKTIDTRLMFNDLFAKLRLNFPAQG